MPPTEETSEKNTESQRIQWSQHILSNIADMEATLEKCIGKSQMGETDGTRLYPCYQDAWINKVPERLVKHTHNFLLGQREVQAINQIRCEIMSHMPMLDSSSKARYNREPSGYPPGALSLLLCQHEMLPITLFSSITLDEQLSASFWLLLDYFRPELFLVEKSGIRYYGITNASPKHVRQALRYAAFCTLVELDPVLWPLYSPRCAKNSTYPNAFMEHTAWYFLTTLGIFGLVSRRNDGSADIGPDLSSIEDDELFAITMHQEWDRLLGFEHGAYGFYVSPNIAWKDAIRYQSLAYCDNKLISKTEGYRKEICWEICSYMLHQALVKIQVRISYAPDQAAKVYEDEVVNLFAPLIDSQAAHVAKLRFEREEKHGNCDHLTRRTTQSSGYKLFFETAKVEAEAFFRDIYQKFDFFYISDTQQAPYAGVGLYRQSGEHRFELPPLYLVPDSDQEQGPHKELSFPYFAETRMKRWSRNEIKNVGLWNPTISLDEDTIPDSRDRTLHYQPIYGPNDSKWITVDRLASLLKGARIHRLQKLDIDLGCRRAGEVFKDDMDAMRRAGLRPKTRLYEDSPDLVHLASVKLGALVARKRNTKTGGLTRAEVSKLCSVPESTLTYWEKCGIVKPIKDGRNIIYTPDQARTVRKRSNAKHSN